MGGAVLIDRPPRERAVFQGRVVSYASALCFLLSAAGCTLLVPGEPTDVHCTEEDAVGPPVCPFGTFCHEGACIKGPPALGEACAASGVCALGDTCLDPGFLGLSGQPICSRPCCSSADCGMGSGLLCAPFSPGKMCIPAESLGRSELGSRFAGEPCDAGADCRSGECAETGTCHDTCCSDAECALFEGSCRSSAEGLMCEPRHPDALSYLAPCAGDSDCASGLCVEWPDGGRRCATPCCSSPDCGDIAIGDALLQILCVPVARDTAVVLACASAVKGGAGRAIGEPCDEPAQCRGGLCIEADDKGTKVCSDVCCTDASCGAPHLFACAPATPLGEGGSPPDHPFDLQCVPR